MGKLLSVLALLSLAVLAIGTVATPQSSAFWLASGSTTYEYIRGLLMVILALQIITRPPRHVVFRLFAGGIALISLSWAISNTYSYAMPLFDSLSFVAAALSIGITALERRGEQHTMYDYRIRTAVSAS